MFWSFIAPFKTQLGLLIKSRTQKTRPPRWPGFLHLLISVQLKLDLGETQLIHRSS